MKVVFKSNFFCRLGHWRKSKFAQKLPDGQFTDDAKEAEENEDLILLPSSTKIVADDAPTEDDQPAPANEPVAMSEVTEAKAKAKAKAAPAGDKDLNL